MINFYISSKSIFPSTLSTDSTFILTLSQREYFFSGISNVNISASNFDFLTSIATKPSIVLSSSTKNHFSIIQTIFPSNSSQICFSIYFANIISLTFLSIS